MAPRFGRAFQGFARHGADAIASAALWRTPIEVKRSHPKASILKRGRVVFNIKGNDCRLVAQINYRAETLEIRFFGGHAEYDVIDAETI